MNQQFFLKYRDYCFYYGFDNDGFLVYLDIKPHIGLSVSDETDKYGFGQQLTKYFNGNLTKFDVKVKPNGTDFQRSVWNVLLTIPYGVSMSYGEVAKAIGKPKAVRAVGGAIGKNPIMIVIPCHRVIGKDGSLTGFSGGLELKKLLIGIENKVAL